MKHHQNVATSLTESRIKRILELEPQLRLRTIRYRWRLGGADRVIETVYVHCTDGRPFLFGEGKEQSRSLPFLIQ